MSANSSDAIQQLLKTLTAFKTTVETKLDSLATRVGSLETTVQSVEQRHIAATADALARLNALHMLVAENANKTTSRAKKLAAEKLEAAKEEATQTAQPTDTIKLTPAAFFKKAYTMEHCNGVVGAVRELVSSFNVVGENGIQTSIENHVINDEDPAIAAKNNKDLQEIKNMPDGPQKLSAMKKFYDGVAVKIFRNLNKEAKESIKKLVANYEWPKAE